MKFTRNATPKAWLCVERMRFVGLQSAFLVLDQNLTQFQGLAWNACRKSSKWRWPKVRASSSAVDLQDQNLCANWAAKWVVQWQTNLVEFGCTMHEFDLPVNLKLLAMQGLSFGRGAFRAVCTLVGESVWEETTGGWSDFFSAVQFSCFCRFSLAPWQKVYYVGEGILDRTQRHRTPVCVLSFVDRNVSMCTKLVASQYLSVDIRKSCFFKFLLFFFFRQFVQPHKNLVR